MSAATFDTPPQSAVDLMPRFTRPARKIGKRSLIYDHKVTTSILAAVEDGVTLTSAAALAGVSVDMIHKWVRRGEDEITRREDGMTPAERTAAQEPAYEDETPYVYFVRALAHARARVETEYVGAIRKSVVGGFVTKRVSRVLADGSSEEEQTFASPDGKLALEFLTRTRPGEYARQRAQVDATVTGPGGGPVEVGGEWVERMAGKIGAAMSQDRGLPEVEGYAEAEVVTERAEDA